MKSLSDPDQVDRNRTACSSFAEVGINAKEPRVRSVNLAAATDNAALSRSVVLFQFLDMVYGIWSKWLGEETKAGQRACDLMFNDRVRQACKSRGWRYLNVVSHEDREFKECDIIMNEACRCCYIICRDREDMKQDTMNLSSVAY